MRYPNSALGSSCAKGSAGDARQSLTAHGKRKKKEKEEEKEKEKKSFLDGSFEVALADSGAAGFGPACRSQTTGSAKGSFHLKSLR